LVGAAFAGLLVAYLLTRRARRASHPASADSIELTGDP
jgi:hypothetical protein